MIQVASNHERATASSSLTAETRDLRWVAAAFELAQSVRLRTGEQIRAVLQNREASEVALEVASDIDTVLSRIRAGAIPGPVPALGDAYRRYWNDERELLRLMSEQLARHPAWPWLERVRGIGPSLAARLLARLEIGRAPTPSSFWSYCGLATVSAQLFRCGECGYERSLPAGRDVRSAHRIPGTTKPCSGSLVESDNGPRRIAQPRPTHGESPPYDQEAKKLCYLIGISLMRQGGAYKRYYHEQSSRLDAAKPDWIARRRRLTALRMTEKLFLAHLWLVWREQLGLPVTAPYAEGRLDASPAPRPWAMVDEEPTIRR